MASELVASLSTDSRSASEIFKHFSSAVDSHCTVWGPFGPKINKYFKSKFLMMLVDADDGLASADSRWPEIQRLGNEALQECNM
jgi:hypothetical protein